MISACYGCGPARLAGLAAGLFPLLLAAAATAQVCDPVAAAHEWAGRAQLTQQAQLASDAARADAQASSYQAPPGIELEAAPGFGSSPETELQALGVWTWDLSRSRELAEQLGELRAAAATEALDLQRMMAAATVLTVFHQALDVDAEARIVEAELAYLDEVLGVTRALVEGGETGQLDVLRIQQRVRTATLARDAHGLELSVLRRALATLAPASCGAEATLASTHFAVGDESPRMAMLDASLSALRAEADLAERSSRPELGFGAGPRLIVGGDGVSTGLVIAISLTPRRPAARRETQAHVAADIARVDLLAHAQGMQDALASPWLALADQLDRLADENDVARDDEATRVLAAVRIGYSSGELDLSAVLETHDALTNDARATASVRSRARAARLRALTLLLGDNP